MESKSDWPLIKAPSPVRRMDAFSIVKGRKAVISHVVRSVDLVVGK